MKKERKYYLEYLINLDLAKPLELLQGEQAIISGYLKRLKICDARKYIFNLDLLHTEK